MSTAFNEGKQAHNYGLDREANPYPRDSEDNYRFTEGWDYQERHANTTRLGDQYG